jgi:Alw26I/Eco31I/Esp3I family type II restriction m6 adenine DNA methyltransferase
VSSIEKLQNKKERVDLNKKQQKVKEGGIHYTPITITDYIVKETVGRFLKERTSDEIKNIKILDPSCGSGSFLTRAYDELLKYYAEQFAKPINELEQSERLPILANGIFGVDLDKQAVEISRLSLLLCALAERKILPPLTDNIKHGNSLISGTSEELQRYFGNSCQDINAFDWRQEFPDIMVNGGFDIVIGNPPWERIKQIKDKKLKNAMGKWFKKKYSYQRGNFNYYKLFLERSFELLKPNGYFAMIFPTAFLGEDSSKTLRKLFFNNASILKVLEFPEKTKVFEKVTQDVTILIYKKIKMDTDYSFLLKTNINAEELNHLDNLNLVSLKRSEIRELTGEDYQIPVFTQPEKELVILKKISQLPSFKGKGSVPSIGTIGEGQLHETFDKKFMSEEPTGDILVKGIHLNRYSVDLSPTGLQPRWVKKTEFLEKKPIVEESLGQERIIGRNTLNKANRPRLLFSVLPSGFIITNAIKSIVLKPNQKLHKNYIIGLLNSPILNWRFELFSSQNNIRNYEIETLPIPHIDFHNPVERKIHDDLVVLVDEMLELYKKIKMLSSLEIEERRLLERDIQRTDKAINGLVYTLYGLTEDEKVTIEFLTTKPIKKKSEQVQLI